MEKYVTTYEMLPEEIEFPEGNEKVKARRHRQSRRAEMEKRKRTQLSVNSNLGRRATKISKRAWHKAQRRELEPCGAYKGNYAMQNVLWAIR